MFVRIEAKYIWYGHNADINFVGPFQDKTTADKWSGELNAEARRQQITVKSDLTPECEPGKILYSTDKTPQAVLSEILDSIHEVCRG